MASPLTSTAPTLPARNSFPQGVVINDYKTLQPRVGFSEDLFGNGKTVLRGGFGTFFKRIQGNDIFGVATSAPFNPSLNIGTGSSGMYFSAPGQNWNTGPVIAPNSLIFAGSGDRHCPDLQSARRGHLQPRCAA